MLLRMNFEPGRLCLAVGSTKESANSQTMRPSPRSTDVASSPPTQRGSLRKSLSASGQAVACGGGIAPSSLLEDARNVLVKSAKLQIRSSDTAALLTNDDPAIGIVSRFRMKNLFASQVTLRKAPNHLSK